MSAELVSIATPGAPLDGLYYAVPNPAGAVLLCHGNTMNFYTGALRFLPPVLTHLGLACLAFNRRGHDILSTRNSRHPEGGAFQLTREAIEDNALAARWLAERGFPAPAVVGHSHGGLLAARHVADHPDTPALVLLSAHGGGKDITPRSSKAGLMAQDRVEEFDRLAHELAATGRGRELMLMPGWWHAISAESWLDRYIDTPDLLELAPAVRCPTLFIRGDQEPAAQYPAEEFQRRAGGRCEIDVVPDCDHFYNGREPDIQARVSAWLRSALGLSAR
jgi:pimeloyl-ACP methyl ester carboxylesterase